MSKVVCKEIQYGAFGRCLSMTNGLVELVVTLDVGPRVIRAGLPGKCNVFAEIPDMTWENGWKIYGGHRLWTAPEAMPLSYALENDPCHYELVENGARFWREKDEYSGLAKEITITLDEETTVVELLHSIRNDNVWPVDYALWALSVMAPGGREVVPFNQDESGFEPNRKLTLWPYTRLQDARLWASERYLALSQTGDAHPFKIGLDNREGWAAYQKEDTLFIKYFMHDLDADYPDEGMSYETYTCDRFLEMESLSGVETVEPGESLEHVEVWELMENPKGLPLDEEALAGILEPLVSFDACDHDCDHCDAECEHHHHD